jgi:hypothetical protein
VPELLTNAINRFRDKGIQMFLSPYEIPTPKLSRLEETARSIIDKMCKSFNIIPKLFYTK